MVQNVNPTFVRVENAGAVQITTGTGSSVIVTIYTGSSNGSKVPGLMATALNTTAAFDVWWGISSGGPFYLGAAVSMPQQAGSLSSVPAVNLFNATNAPGLTIDSDGNPFLFLPSSAWSLQAKMPALSSAWASGALVNLVAASIGDF